MSRLILVPPGTKFNRLTYLSDVAPLNGRRRARFLCECGQTIETPLHGVRYGHILSCGCYLADVLRAVSLLHGDTTGRNRTPEYRAWMSMKERCANLADPNYGGRGIRVCPEWQHNFSTFLAHVGRKPSRRHSLDRIDVNGHYEPGNVRWATSREQARNTRLTRFITINGDTRPLRDWADITGIKVTTVGNRLQRGWSEYDAVFRPAETKKCPKKYRKGRRIITNSLITRRIKEQEK